MILMEKKNVSLAMEPGIGNWLMQEDIMNVNVNMDLLMLEMLNVLLVIKNVMDARMGTIQIV